jgi:hypothetical protein
VEESSSALSNLNEVIGLGWYTVVKAYNVGLTHLNGKQVHGLTNNFSNSTTNERIDRTEICLELNTMDHDMIGSLLIKSPGCRV